MTCPDTDVILAPHNEEGQSGTDRAELEARGSGLSVASLEIARSRKC